MGPLPRRALAAAAAVAVLAAGGGWLLLASRDASPEARLRPGAGAGGDGRPDGRWVAAQDADGFVGYRVRERLGSISAPTTWSAAPAPWAAPSLSRAGRSPAPR